jgi:hypothetical protein
VVGAVLAAASLVVEAGEAHRGQAPPTGPAKPRSRTCLYVYFGCVRPLLENWATTRDHLREVTIADVTAALSPLCGWQRRNAIAALHSLFRFAKKRGLIFANPTTRLRTEDI